MNSSANSNPDTSGQTGGLKTEEPPNSAKSTGGLIESNGNVLIVTVPETGIFTNNSQEGVLERVEGDDDYEKLKHRHIKSEEIFMTGTDEQIRMRIMDECEELFLQGILTGRSQADMLNHILNHFENGISFAIVMASLNMEASTDPTKFISTYKPEDVVFVFYKKIKLIVQTYVEYLHFVKGIEWYELKSFIANLGLNMVDRHETAKSLASSSETYRQSANSEVLSFYNTFLPGLIGAVKEEHRNDLTPFTFRLEEIISYLNKNRESGFDVIIRDNQFKKNIEFICSEYLTIDSIQFKKILARIFSHNTLTTHFSYPTDQFDSESVVEGNVATQELPTGFSVLRKLTSSRFIGNNMDFFINFITRILRQRSFPDLLRPAYEDAEGVVFAKLLNSINYPLAESSVDSRTSIYDTRRRVEEDIDTRIAAQVIPQELVEKFNAKVAESINLITVLSSDQVDANQQILRKLFENDGTEFIEIEDPTGVIDIFITIFESAVSMIDDELFITQGTTISDDSIFTLLSVHFAELERRFNINSSRTHLVLMYAIDYYLLTLMGKKQNEILEYIKGISSSIDYHFEFDRVRILQEYIPSLRKKIKAKMAIAYSETREPTEDERYSRYLLETLATLTRRTSHYYIDTFEEFLEDFFATPKTDNEIAIFIRVFLMKIVKEAPHTFMKIELTASGITNVDYERMAKILNNFLERNERFKEIASRVLRVSKMESLEKILKRYLTNPGMILLEG